MKQGDLVRLKQPFTPTVAGLQFYSFGIVVGVVSEGASLEVLVHLCASDRVTLYTDETGAQAIYSFQMDEIKLVSDRSSS